MLNALPDLEALPVSSVILDSSGTIVGVNEVWKDLGRRNGLRLPNFGVGSRYLAYCGADGSESGVARDIVDLLAGRLDLITHFYPCEFPGKTSWFMLLAFPLSLSGAGGIAILHTDVSNLLPLPIVEGLLSRRRATGERNAKPATLAAICANVEASVSNALSSQLHAMLSLPPSHSDKAGAPSTASDEAFLRSRLSKRQMEVLQLLSDGKSNKEIAELLCRSPHTIKLHVSAILRQLDVKTRTQAALLASQLPKLR